MKINIASSGGRSHVMDLAIELEKHGHEVNFYSYVPTNRALKYGLKRKCSKSYFILALPFLVLLKITNRAHWVLFLYHYCFDIITAWIMKPCDVFIGLSPMHVYVLKYVKKKYNATVILERGTSHVIEQVKVLKGNPALKGKNPMPNMFMKRDLAGYELADYISIASNHVLQSFVKNNTSIQKIFVNPYGVNLSEFNATKLEDDEDVYDIIMVGQWCHRKGCDFITEAINRMNVVKFLHVGPIVDMSFPVSDNMKHIDSVDQKELINYYKKSKIFVLPSREEGLALVQLQAVVCGLPIVCSKFTGGRDLKEYIDDPKWIIEMPELTIDTLITCINQALKLSETQKGKRSYSKNIAQELSWKGYGNRYNNFLLKIK
ncbi:glycosyltransferase family 4 protein [Lutibacter holmesii]|uniref:Glycosyltransferase family 4 protein n=1 Tax=Lutibacter holmesii TaxID=1137985 RepID=A0ABW3WRR7_9FLAO